MSSCCVHRGYTFDILILSRVGVDGNGGWSGLCRGRHECSSILSL